MLRVPHDAKMLAPVTRHSGYGEYYFQFDIEAVRAHVSAACLMSRPKLKPKILRRCRRLSALCSCARAIDGAIVFTHGFGVEGQLIFHWICEHELDIDVVTLDTGRLFPETYELWAETERRYGRRIRAVYPNTKALERLVAKQGIDGIYESKQARLSCCDVRKSKPLDRALAGAAAWITGLRADQNANRREAGLIGFDASRGLLKFNPLHDWTREAVLAEVRRHDIPINSLHAKGFASIGCAPCTRALRPGEARAQWPLVVGKRRRPRVRAASAAQGSDQACCQGQSAARPHRDERRLRLSVIYAA